MALATPTHLSQLRDALNHRLQELRAEVHAAERSQRELTDAAAQEVTDRKDNAMQQQFSDISSAQEQRDLNEIGQVEAALGRLDGGSYGDCADCGKPIVLQRLRVQPAALRCAPCQATREHARPPATRARAS